MTIKTKIICDECQSEHDLTDEVYEIFISIAINKANHPEGRGNITTKQVHACKTHVKDILTKVIEEFKTTI